MTTEPLYIVSLGGIIHYNTRLEKLVVENGRVKGAVTNRGEISCGTAVLAVGHSARDTYEYLRASGFEVMPKPFSVGVRIEHLQADIDRAVYGKHAGNPVLPPAEYAMSKRAGGRGVYTFCMCPGGEVVAAASEEGGIVTNGMSRYARDGRNANAAIAVSVESDDPIGFQRRLERAAFNAGGGEYAAPVQTVGDFMRGISKHNPSRILPTYMNGNVKMSDLTRIFSSDITEMLRLGLSDFDRKIPGFAADDAVLTGVETRTSAPVRILRNEEMTAVGFYNIYPCGEGAGYAGGITSAAVDGLKCAIRIINRYKVR